MNRQQKERLTQFVGITGADAPTGTRCLEAAGWSVEGAIEVFYSNGMDAIHRLFLRYRDDEGGEDGGEGGGGGVIGVDGITQLCEDLGVAPDDAVVLVLSWHFGAEAMCEYSRAQFEDGMASLACDSIDKLKAKLPALRQELQDPAKYKQIYQFAYLFSREKGQKIVQLDVALAMWDLLLPPSRWQHVEAWAEFLRTHHKRAISRDTWNQLLDFIQSTAPDFSNYDENAAWPYILDDFVAWKREGGGGAAGGAA